MYFPILSFRDKLRDQGTMANSCRIHNLIISVLTYIKPHERWWFYVATIATTIVVAMYIVLHLVMPGSELKYLDKEQLGVINSILDDSVGGAESRTQVAIYLADILYPGRQDQEVIRNEIKERLDDYQRAQLRAALPTLPFTIDSFFWLCGTCVFLELILWSLFGVGASILYRVSEAISKDEFQITKVPIHIAKLIYAPLSTVVIFLSIEVFFGDGSIVVDDISSWAIVLAFILGFYSGRTVELLRRLKDVILPLGGENDPLGRSAAGQIRVALKGQIVLASTDLIVDQVDFSTAALWLSATDNPAVIKSTNADQSGSFSFGDVVEGNYELRGEFNYKDIVFGGATAVKVAVGMKEVSLVLQPTQEELFRFMGSQN